MLLLPEVMSNLQFEKRDFAPEGDTAAEAALREASTWGRVYVDGWPTSIQYLRGHFGLSPPTGTHDIVLAEPLDACMPLANAAGRIVIAQRGVCTFGTKANRTAEAGAAALLVVNDADGLIHMPGPDAHDVKLSISMIGKWEGNQLMSSMRAAEAPLRASLVPINCNEHSETLQVDSLCEATNADERKFTHNQTEVRAPPRGGVPRANQALGIFDRATEQPDPCVRRQSGARAIPGQCNKPGGPFLNGSIWKKLRPQSLPSRVAGGCGSGRCARERHTRSRTQSALFSGRVLHLAERWRRRSALRVLDGRVRHERPDRTRRRRGRAAQAHRGVAAGALLAARGGLCRFGTRRGAPRGARHV